MSKSQKFQARKHKICVGDRQNQFLCLNDVDIFVSLFENEFVPLVRNQLHSNKLEERVLLLLGRCTAHSSTDVLKSKVGRIKIMFLPKNVAVYTALIQPMDLGISQVCKVVLSLLSAWRC
jgi:hypothetical protein